MHMNSSRLSVWRFLTAYVALNGFPPTVREIGTACYLSNSAIDYHLGRLQAAGVLKREPHQARNIRLLRDCPVGE